MKLLVLSIPLLLLSACASDRIIVDQQGTDMSSYSRDLAECRAYAEQVPTGSEVAKGTVGGAVVGGVLGAIVGDSQTAGRGAGAGAVTGGLRGGHRAEQEKDRGPVNIGPCERACQGRHALARRAKRDSAAPKVLSRGSGPATKRAATWNLERILPESSSHMRRPI